MKHIEKITTYMAILLAFCLLFSSCQFDFASGLLELYIEANTPLEERNLKEYRLSNNICDAIFGIDSATFVKTKGADTSLANGYTLAEVTEDNTLILKLTDHEVDSWRNHELCLQILQKILGEEKKIVSQIIPPTDSLAQIFYENADIDCGFDISDDYSKIVMRPEDDESYILVVPKACLLMQVLEGVPSDEIFVEYFSLDENGEVIQHITFPRYSHMFMFQDIQECKQLKVYEQVPSQITEYFNPNVDPNYNELPYSSFWGMKYVSENLEYEIFAYEYSTPNHALNYYVNITNGDITNNDDSHWFESFDNANNYELIVIEENKVYVISASSLYVDTIYKMLSETFSIAL